jgi:transposase
MTYEQLVFEGRDNFEVDRETETVARWLKAHPGVRIVTRDLFVNFANAVTQTSPAIVQVADRWHLLHNLTEAIEKMLRRNNHYLRDARDEQISAAQQKRTRANKLKTIKRQMYGRASFELLRKRLIYQSAPDL